MKTSSTLLLDLINSPYFAHMVVHFASWTLPIPRCDDLIIEPATFRDIVYVPGIGGFPMDALFIVM